jgi:hypothetical protein
MYYSDFSYGGSSVNATSIPEDQLRINSVSSTPAANGFQFSLPLIAVGATGGTGQTEDVSLSYTVTDTTPGSLITSVDVPVLVGTEQNGGVAQLNETVTGPKGLLGTIAVTPGKSGSLSFAGVTTVTISKDLIVTGGLSSTGSASISLFADYVNEAGTRMGTVPEPGFYGVLAAGLVVFYSSLRRRKRAHDA